MNSNNLLKQVVLLCGLLSILLSLSKAQDVTINAYKFNTEPILDGNIDDAWATNDFLQISNLLSMNDTIAEEDFSGSFKISWYNNVLYFLFVVTDDIFLRNEGMPIWYGDNINLYLDLGNEKSSDYDNNDYLCQFKWGNSDYYERYNGNDLVLIDNSSTAVEFAQTCDTLTHTFIMEIAIRNLTELNGPAVLDESTAIGLDAGIYDIDDANSGIFSDHLSWVDTTGMAWSDPSKLGTSGFGTITLKSAKNPIVLGRTENENPVKLYPTFVSDNLYIEKSLSDDLKVDVMTLHGIKVASFVVDSDYSCIDVSSLNTGLYFANVYTEERLICSQKIILSR